MAAFVSTSAKEMMGFRRIADGELIAAAFHCIHVYEIQGFTVNDGTLLSTRGAVSGAAYTVAIGSSVNELATALVADDLAADEVAWAKEHGCTPPYVLVHFGPTAQHSCADGHVRVEASGLTTFDAFTAANSLHSGALDAAQAAQKIHNLASEVDDLAEQVQRLERD